MARRIICVLVIAGALVCGAASAGVADSTPPPAPLSASPAAPAFGADGTVDVMVTNETGVELDISNRSVVSKGDVVTSVVVTDNDPSIGPGRSVQLTVSTKQQPVPKDGVTLVIVVPPGAAVGSQGFVLRVPLAPVAASSPAVSTWTITDRNWGIDRGGQLPLTGRCGDLGITNGSSVGVLAAGGTSLKISATCVHPSDAYVTLSWPQPGWTIADYDTFKGTITLGSGDAAKVTTEATTTTGLGPFLVLIAVGVGIALACGAWQGGGRADQQMKIEALRVASFVSPANLKNADALFRSTAAAHPALDARFQQWSIRNSVQDDINAVLSKFQGDQANGADDAVKTARAALQVIEGRAQGWPAAANRLAELVARTEELRVMKQYADAAFAVTVDLSPVDSQLTTPQVDTLQAKTVEALALAKRLDAKRIDTDRQIAKNNREKPEAAAYLAALDTVATETAPDALDAAVGRLILVQSALEASAWFDGAGKAMQILPLAGAAGVTPYRPIKYDDPVGDARAFARRMRLFDHLVFWAVLLAAVVGAIATLWDGKAFGGWIDWCTAIAWGLGSATISGAAAVALGNVRRSDGIVKGLAAPP